MPEGSNTTPAYDALVRYEGGDCQMWADTFVRNLDSLGVRVWYDKLVDFGESPSTSAGDLVREGATCIKLITPLAQHLVGTCPEPGQGARDGSSTCAVCPMKGARLRTVHVLLVPKPFLLEPDRIRDCAPLELSSYSDEEYRRRVRKLAEQILQRSVPFPDDAQIENPPRVWPDAALWNCALDIVQFLVAYTRLWKRYESGEALPEVMEPSSASNSNNSDQAESDRRAAYRNLLRRRCHDSDRRLTAYLKKLRRRMRAATVLAEFDEKGHPWWEFAYEYIDEAAENLRARDENARQTELLTAKVDQENLDNNDIADQESELVGLALWQETEAKRISKELRFGRGPQHPFHGGGEMRTQFASTFISHSSKQRQIAETLAHELCRYGILAWLDRNELPPGVDLDVELRKASEAQLTMTALISKESLASEWCNEELAPRLEANEDSVIPVYFGSPLELVRQSPLLRSRWLTADGGRVRKRGVQVANTESVEFDRLALDIARRHYEVLELDNKSQLIIAIDQRGKGRRVGSPDALLPDNWRDKPWPGLVFRPNQHDRSDDEVLHGPAWQAFRDTILRALGESTRIRQQRQVYVTGHAQLAVSWTIGQFFDRSSNSKLVAYNPGRLGQLLCLDFNEERFQNALPGVAPGDVNWEGGSCVAGASEISVYIGPESYEKSVKEYRVSSADATPLASLHTKTIASEEDVVAIARWLTTASNTRAVRLYTALPFHALVLLAAMLKHSLGPITFMEWDRRERTYRACSVTQ